MLGTRPRITVETQSNLAKVALPLIRPPAPSPRKRGEGRCRELYLIALSVIALVQAPDGSLVMIF